MYFVIYIIKYLRDFFLILDNFIFFFLGSSVWKFVIEFLNYKLGEDKCYGLVCICSNIIKYDLFLLFDIIVDLGERNFVSYKNNKYL